MIPRTGVIQTINPDGGITSVVYDGAGKQLATIDALGHTNSYAFDYTGNLVSTSYADGTVETSTLGRMTTNVFDALNRQFQTLYPDGTHTEITYDADGRKTMATNQDNFVTWFGYDGAGRLTSVTNALTNVTRYQYDEAGNQTNQIDALNRTNVYVYDNLGRRTKHITPGSQWEGMAYDLDGNLLYETNFNGAVMTNQYDLINRLINKASAGGFNVAYTYTLTGQCALMMDATGTTTNSYDNRDRLLAKTEIWSNGPTISLNYAYDPEGSVTNIWSSTTNGVNLSYQYDAFERLTNVQANGNTIANYGFDGAGNLQRGAFGNGVTNFYQYDILNRLTNMVWKLNSSTLATHYYQLGLTGNRTDLTENVNGTNHIYGWQYDRLYRMTDENISGIGSAAYGLDPVGNRLTRSNASPQTLAYNTNDWLTTDSYDSNGNTLSTTNGGTTSGPYYYDVENRLTNFDGASFGYNGDGVRVSKSVGGTNTYYLVDDRNLTGYAQVVEEWTSTTGSATLSRVYNYGMGLISQQVSTNGPVHYYGMDGQGSVRFLTDTNGTVTDDYTYDAYAVKSRIDTLLCISAGLYIATAR